MYIHVLPEISEAIKRNFPKTPQKSCLFSSTANVLCAPDEEINDYMHVYENSACVCGGAPVPDGSMNRFPYQTEVDVQHSNKILQRHLKLENKNMLKTELLHAYTCTPYSISLL